MDLHAPTDRAMVERILRRMAGKGWIIISTESGDVFKICPSKGPTANEIFALDHGRRHIAPCLRILEAERRNAEAADIEQGIPEMPAVR